MVDMLLPPPRNADNRSLDEALGTLPDSARAFWFLGDTDGRSQDVIILVTCSGATSEVSPSLDTIRNAVSRNVNAFLTSINDMSLLFGDEAFNRAQSQYKIELPEEMRPQEGERMRSIQVRCLSENLSAYLNPLGTSNNPLLCGVIRITPVIWVVRWVSFQKRRC
jgi:hypothetical protein